MAMIGRGPRWRVGCPGLGKPGRKGKVNMIETGRFCPNPAMSWTGAGGELVLFDRESGKYHALNASASGIWRALQDQETVTGIVTALSGTGPAPPELLRRDVIEFLGHALAAGLILAKE